MKKSLLLSLSFIPALSFGMEYQSNNNANQIITPYNLYTQSAALPNNSAEIVKQWTNQNKDFLHNLIKDTDGLTLDSLDAIRNETIQGIQDLKSKNIENKSKSNYVFQLPNSNFWMQFSGPLYKAISLLHHNDKGWNDVKNISLGIIKKRVATFQTVSRFAHYFKCKEALEKHSITQFDVPKTYLIQLPGRSSIETFACDANSIVIQENRSEHLVPIRENLKYLESVDPQALEEAVQVIKGGILWDFHGNGLINTQNNTFGQSDLEQPAHSRPHLFFYNSSATYDHQMIDLSNFLYQHDIACGIKGFINLFAEAKNKGLNVDEHCNELKNIIFTDKELRTMNYQWQHIEKELEKLNN